MKLLKCLLIVSVLCIAALGQESDRWRGLILDVSTPEDAIAKLGKPAAERDSDKFMSYRLKSLREIKDLRVLHWEKAEGFDDVKLYFAAGTLAIIQLEKPKEKIPAKVFVEAYPDAFFDVAPRPRSSVYYEIEAVTAASRINAGVGNVSGSVGRSLFGGLGQGGKIPTLEGNVMRVIIQSRRVDDRRGLDGLK